LVYRRIATKITTQFDMNRFGAHRAVEDDFLGLTTLTVAAPMQLKMVEQNRGVKGGHRYAELDDAETYKLFTPRRYHCDFPIRIARHARHPAALSATR